MTGVDDATTTFTNIANAIRSKTGTSSKMKITEMASKINGISVGITPSGTKSITSNGTYDISSYQYASVNVDSTPKISNVGASASLTWNYNEDEKQTIYGVSNVVWSVNSSLPSNVTATLKVSGSGKATYQTNTGNLAPVVTSSVPYSGSVSLSNSALKSGSYKITSSSGHVVGANIRNLILKSAQISITLTLSDGTAASGSMTYNSS